MNLVEITKNEHNTFFVSINGVAVADSATIKRQRGFWNKVTKQFTCGKKFTRKNIKKDPYIVLQYLDKTGIPIEEGVWAVREDI